MFLLIGTHIFRVKLEHASIFIKFKSYFRNFRDITSELQLATLKKQARASVFTGHRRGGHPRDPDHVSETGAPGAEWLWERGAPHVSQLQLLWSEAPQTAAAVLRGRGRLQLGPRRAPVFLERNGGDRWVQRMTGGYRAWQVGTANDRWVQRITGRCSAWQVGAAHDRWVQSMTGRYSEWQVDTTHDR